MRLRRQAVTLRGDRAPAFPWACYSKKTLLSKRIGDHVRTAPNPASETAQIRVLDDVITFEQEAKIENRQLDRAMGGMDLVQNLQKTRTCNLDQRRTSAIRPLGPVVSIEDGRNRGRVHDGCEIRWLQNVVESKLRAREEVQSGGDDVELLVQDVWVVAFPCQFQVQMQHLQSGRAGTFTAFSGMQHSAQVGRTQERCRAERHLQRQDSAKAEDDICRD